MFDSRHKLFGRWLHRFCIDDFESLSKIGNPLVLGETTWTPRDLASAVFVLSRRIRPSDVEEDCWKRAPKLHRLWYSTAQCRFNSGLNILAEYMDDCWDPPKMIETTGAGKTEVSAPMAEYMRAFVVKNRLATTLEEAGWFPLSDALGYHETIKEMDTGETGRMSETEKAIGEFFSD